MKQAYKSDLRLGEKYKDNTTGLEGTLIAINDEAMERCGPDDEGAQAFTEVTIR